MPRSSYGIARIIVTVVASTILSVVIVPVVGEFFIEIAKEHHVYELPYKWPGEVMSSLRAISDLLWLREVAIFLAGITIGMWVDTFARRRVERPKDELAPLVKEWLDPIEAIKRFANADLAAFAAAIRQKAELLKPEINSLKTQYDAEVAKLPFGPAPNHDSELVADLGQKHRAACDQLNQFGEQIWLLERKITDDIIAQLKNGNLAAKGFRQTKDSVSETFEAIPKDQWQLLKFDTYDTHMQTVRGGNWKYITLQIGRNENKRR
jgi:hypothetical protein